MSERSPTAPVKPLGPERNPTASQSLAVLLVSAVAWLLPGLPSQQLSHDAPHASGRDVQYAMHASGCAGDDMVKVVAWYDNEWCVALPSRADTLALCCKHLLYCISPPALGCLSHSLNLSVLGDEPSLGTMQGLLAEGGGPGRAHRAEVDVICASASPAFLRERICVSGLRQRLP